MKAKKGVEKSCRLKPVLSSTLATRKKKKKKTPRNYGGKGQNNALLGSCHLLFFIAVFFTPFYLIWPANVGTTRVTLVVLPQSILHLVCFCMA